jgi:hypothetical protein
MANYWGDSAVPLFRSWMAEKAVMFALSFVPLKAGARQPLLDGLAHLQAASRIIKENREDAAIKRRHSQETGEST